MANILDYLTWRGDLSLRQDKFNEIDNLILARFAYFPFDSIIKKNEFITIEEAYHRFENSDISKERILQKEDMDLFPAIAKSKRFGKLKIGDYENYIEIQQDKQFAAINVFLQEDEIIICYRGTDNTIVGWKEDFNMSFKTHVASQLDAVNYLERIVKNYPNKRIRMTGHSKGGNLAVYAAIFSKKEIQDKIIKIYNNDGPGFDDETIHTEKYQRIIKKVHTYIPQTSIIGRLLNHQEKYTIIKSTQMGIMQHDLYSWQIEGKEYITLKEITNGSEFVNQTIRNWLKKVTPEQREQFFNILFDILKATEATTLKDLKVNKLANARIILKSYQNIEDESKEILSQTLHALFEIAKSNLVLKLPQFKRKNKNEISEKERK